MALFVDLDEETEPPKRNGYYHLHGVNLEWHNGQAKEASTAPSSAPSATMSDNNGSSLSGVDPSKPLATRENPNQNAMTEALGCYPIVMAIASSLDLNTLDSLSRTCRQVRGALLQYRSSLVTHTLHCENDNLPIDPEDTLRYRARACNWYYMDDGRGDYSSKSGSCARDMVAECRRCARVVCRNCAIKPPAPIVLRDRHRRLCIPCTKAPLGSLVRPPLRPDTPVDADEMQRAICTIWKWRSQYGDVIGGVGTGIGEGDRGVICGRGEACSAAREREQETDCDAEDAREVDLLNKGPSTPPPSWSYAASTSSNHSSNPQSSRSHTPEAGASSNAGSSSSSANSWLPPLSSSPDFRRTPTPASQQRPGYARHEIEGIGGVVKTKLVRIVRVGACVPEWEDERHSGQVLGHEVSGRARSWCGWCWRVIPGEKDYEAKTAAAAANGNGKGNKGKLPLR
ncbi:hypothetical protein DL768_008127 [Monosporascus sp. mg162]|nr:hypothetical protein DL768_008127 [Monosporascus sp. mg162]